MAPLTVSHQANDRSEHGIGAIDDALDAQDSGDQRSHDHAQNVDKADEEHDFVATLLGMTPKSRHTGNVEELRKVISAKMIIGNLWIFYEIIFFAQKTYFFCPKTYFFCPKRYNSG
jgi:hypothetical protein